MSGKEHTFYQIYRTFSKQQRKSQHLKQRTVTMNNFSLLLLHQEWTAKEHSVYNFTKYQERFEVELPWKPV